MRKDLDFIAKKFASYPFGTIRRGFTEIFELGLKA